MTAESNTYGKPAMRPERFVTLDGMRGVGAILVVCFHFSLVGLLPSPQLGYLAVDMFFALSGFVLALSSDPQLAAGMTAWQFMRKRALRLYPLYLIGFLIGAIQVFSLRHNKQMHSSDWVTLLMNFLILPTLDYRAFGHTLTPIDGPSWSLFLEFWVANLSFAVFWRWIRGVILYVVIAAGAVGLIVSQLTFHSLDVGSTYNAALGGFARLAFSFYIGVWLARFYCHSPPQRRVPSALILMSLGAILCAPVSGTMETTLAFASIMVVFPAMIYWGAGAVERNPRIGQELGNLSYAVYVVHVPLLFIATSIMRRWHMQPSNLAGEAILFGVCLLSLLLHHLYDKPLRRWLNRLMRQKHKEDPYLS